MRIKRLDECWRLPEGVRACATLRAEKSDLGGGLGPDRALSQQIAAHRDQLRSELGVKRIVFLEQVHGIAVHLAGPLPEGPPAVADAVVTAAPGVACAVLTADCLPVLLCSRRGDRVAAAHAGGRGLSAGVLEATLAQFETGGAGVSAYLGAAIGPASFEVGPEVRAAFLTATPALSAQVGDCFVRGSGDRWFADLYGLARLRLAAAGVTDVQGGGEDTCRDAGRWFSCRRDGDQAGRQATLIWIERGLNCSG